ncbi:acyl--CoA ligase [Mycobacterium intracellulare]|uniref:Class I adenylate-forming enzyme family protein n=1 Tax=Mycobacterium intracellulare TaxID=1767 RepID=A0AAE4RER0_MYCIT|nr:class I adenylate-forming enzyme family protein [Mycobacterium intracellulare]MCA2321558.1 acyl--CoA ligase [Mycobacterium intracellulare]MCA2341804.1 acyl--CoA ligase [Mycobacterium intracellulare]MDV6977909.1 class I adenylate-forming enzyme family protein [Mycobacterium intracellulare]MDV6983323.1 class I adenylate-forming enzyme family protein [Mycobacterium intracellulare]MDV7014345.1 class I adenylate-forming enzyme family protein [Mycobacterium intracellulare]
MPPVIEIARDHNPFPTVGVSRGPDGIPRYDELPATLLDMLAEHVDTRPGSEALVELGGGRLTYRQLWDRAARVAGGLRAEGIKRGDRVAVRYPAGIDWVLAFWGVVMAGGIAVAVNTRSAQPEVDFVLSDSGAGLDLAPDSPLPDGAPYVSEQLGRTDVAALFYTSGTTGHPKGVPTTHEAFLTNTENAIRCLQQPRDLGEGMRTLISVPLFHVTGCNSQLLAAARLGGASVIMPTLNLDALIAALGAERVSVLVTVPAIYSLLLRHKGFAGTNVSGIRWVGYGGAPIAPSLVRTVKNAFGHATVFNGYGMTETASLMTVLPDGEAVDHADSVGYAVPSVDLGLIPLGDEPGVGELVTRGANVTAGYWNRPEATATTFADGWLHTGDVVRVDDAGRVHLIDRLKDIINRGGENVSSVEVEAVLLGAPHVADACVLGVADDVMGEKVGAVLFGGDDDIDVPAVLEHCRGRLADFKVPQYVTVVDTALPRNAGGKLLKARLREQVRWGEPLR